MPESDLSSSIILAVGIGLYAILHVVILVTVVIATLFYRQAEQEIHRK